MHFLCLKYRYSPNHIHRSTFFDFDDSRSIFHLYIHLKLLYLHVPNKYANSFDYLS
ncbi:hypothetical protein RDI58_019403 [Solanum bulbocastanum]|uniref:Uncharacterized protein n=1 Tax=Solanum bulbocastanum TaxID=147425 RepID=A0AAN8TAK3_SOLBU